MEFETLRRLSTRQMFQFEDPEGNKYAWDISRMAPWLQDHVVPQTVDVSRAYAEAAAVINDVRKDYAARLPHEVLLKPVVIVVFPDDTMLCVDGSHRLYRQVILDGRNEVQAYVIPKEIADQFVYHDVPGQVRLVESDYDQEAHRQRSLAVMHKGEPVGDR